MARAPSYPKRAIRSANRNSWAKIERVLTLNMAKVSKWSLIRTVEAQDSGFEGDASEPEPKLSNDVREVRLVACRSRTLCPQVAVSRDNKLSRICCLTPDASTPLKFSGLETLTWRELGGSAEAPIGVQPTTPRAQLRLPVYSPTSLVSVALHTALRPPQPHLCSRTACGVSTARRDDI